MIDREYGEIRLLCDECGDWQRGTYDKDDFNRMIRDAKEDGLSVIQPQQVPADHTIAPPNRGDAGGLAADSQTRVAA